MVSLLDAPDDAHVNRRDVEDSLNIMGSHLGLRLCRMVEYSDEKLFPVYCCNTPKDIAQHIAWGPDDLRPLK